MKLSENDILLFPTFIKKYDNFINEEECINIIKILKKIPLNSHDNLTKNKSYSSHCLFKQIHIQFENEFNNKLMSAINEYTEKCGYKKLIISNSWHNIQYKNSFLTRHCHPHSIISGVLYLKVDELSSKLFFYNPNPYIHFTDYKENNFLNFKHYFFEIKNRCLILFPSWLQHGSGEQENKSEERICFSFNTEYEKNETK